MEISFTNQVRARDREVCFVRKNFESYRQKIIVSLKKLVLVSSELSALI